MKSYGKPDSSLDKSKIRRLLEDVSDMAINHNATFYMGEDKQGNIVVAPKAERELIRIFVCGVSPRKIPDHRLDSSRKEETEIKPKTEFWDNVAYASYTIEKMIPRVYDCLINKIIEYGRIGFLSEGRVQLRGAFSDAYQLATKYGKAFIIGYTKNGIAVAPTAEQSRFIEPFSYVVTKNGTWHMSEIHCTRHNFWPGGFQYALVYEEKSYGRFDPDYNSCIVHLEDAFEDAVKMPRRDDQSIYVVLDEHGGMVVRRDRRGIFSAPHIVSITVSPDEFLDEGKLLPDKIRNAASEAYDKFNAVYDAQMKEKQEVARLWRTDFG